MFYSSGGSSWFISSLNVINIKSIAVNGNLILAGAGGNAGVYLSTNNGNNWTATSLNNRTVYSVVINGSYAYAGTGRRGILFIRIADIPGHGHPLIIMRSFRWLQTGVRFMQERNKTEYFCLLITG
ncbi:MAG: hypothetical protein IPM96_02010 [Ignavibacteria bacterium]|nr:hypothetical protein [Ignavibacteria bacterium]